MSDAKQPQTLMENLQVRPSTEATLVPLIQAFSDTYDSLKFPDADFTGSIVETAFALQGRKVIQSLALGDLAYVAFLLGIAYERQRVMSDAAIAPPSKRRRHGKGERAEVKSDENGATETETPPLD